MKRIWLVVFALLALGIPPGFAHAETYTVISSNSAQYGSITRTETVIQVGADPLNRFTMHRVRKNIPDHAMILTSMNSRLRTITSSRLRPSTRCTITMSGAIRCATPVFLQVHVNNLAILAV
jgi:hypothetical protein